MNSARQTLTATALAIAFGAIASFASAQAVQKPVTSGAHSITYATAEQFTIQSRITGRTYTISVAQPRLPSPEFSLYRLPAPAKFPVVYSTDADRGGFMMVGQLGQLMQGGEDIPPFYAVGIGYGQDDFLKFMELRQKDLTPTVDPKAPEIFAKWGMGGAADFLRFIQEELKPEIARRYPVDNAQSSISGLSDGGLFALWALFTHPDSFAGYIALDPANWDDWVGERIEKAFAEHPTSLTGKRLYMGIESPNYADPRMTFFTHALRDRWLKFCDTVKSRNYEGLAFKCEAEAGESHFSTAAPGTTQGLRWVMPVTAKLAVTPSVPKPTGEAH